MEFDACYSEEGLLRIYCQLEVAQSGVGVLEVRRGESQRERAEAGIGVTGVWSSKVATQLGAARVGEILMRPREAERLTCHLRHEGLKLGAPRAASWSEMKT